MSASTISWSSGTVCFLCHSDRFALTLYSTSLQKNGYEGICVCVFCQVILRYKNKGEIRHKGKEIVCKFYYYITHALEAPRNVANMNWLHKRSIFSPHNYIIMGRPDCSNNSSRLAAPQKSFFFILRPSAVSQPPSILACMVAIKKCLIGSLS